jgi:uncharacterized protein involved in outer membrane biogenesis
VTPARLARRVAGAMLALLVLGVVVGELSGWPFLRQPLADALTRAAGVPVQLDGNFRTRLLWRPQIKVEHLNVGAGGGVAVPHLVDARVIELAWSWGDVWRWHRQGEPLRVQRLQATALDAHLVRIDRDHASWQIGRQPPPQPSQPERSLTETLPRFGAFVVEQGFVIVDDPLTETKLRIDIAGREGDALPDSTLPDEQAGYRASVNGRWRTLPLQLKISAGGSLPLLDEDPEAPLVPVRIEGRAGASTLLFDGQAGALLGARKLGGKLQLRGPSLAQVGEPLGVTLPQTPPFALQGALRHDAGLWHLRADRASIGSSRLSGDFDFDTRPKTPLLKGRLSGTRLALADLGPAIGTTGTGDPKAAAKKPPPGRVLPDRRFDLPSLRAMDADVHVEIDELAFGSDKLAELRELRTQIVLAGGVLTLTKLQAAVAGGTFGGSTRLDSNTKPAQWQADLRFATVDIAGWITGLKTPAGAATQPETHNRKALQKRRDEARAGGAEPAKAYLTGAVDGHVKASGRGRSTAEILGTLDGRAHVFLRDGTMSHLATEGAGLDIAQALGVLVRGDRPLVLNCARLDLDIVGGIVRPRVAVLDNKDTTIRIDGQLNLRTEALNLRAVAKPKDLSLFALRTPVTIKGTLGSPNVGIEGQRIAGRAVAAVVLGAAVAPLAALLPFIDLGEKQASPCESGAAQAAAPPAAALRTAPDK